MYAYAVENQRKNWFTGVRHTRNQQKQLILSIGDRTDLQRKMSFVTQIWREKRRDVFC